jgi:hypothetical protein
MRDTTLNALAIVIFLTTLASLLGPLVHLSPLVVAGVAATGLGVFTLDQLNLEGRLGGLISDGLAWLSPGHRQRILHHEAGHLVVATLLQVPLTGYALSPWAAWRQGWRGQAGVIAALPGATAETLTTPLWIDRYCQVWMAGIAAEEMIYGEALGGDADVLALQRFWQTLDRPQGEAAVKQRWAQRQARALLECHRQTYEAVVQAMATGAEIEACCQLVTDPFKTAGADCPEDRVS